MIWDVLYYADYILSESGLDDWVWQLETFESKLLAERHKKRTPIEDQPDSCVLFVLSLMRIRDNATEGRYRRDRRNNDKGLKEI